METISVTQRKKGFWLDPRTKMLLTITIPPILISAGDYGVMIWLKPILILIPYVLLLLSRKIKLSIIFASLSLLAYIAQIVLIPNTRGILNVLVVALCGVLFRFMPGIMMGAYLVTTTKVSEFMAAMNRIHMPEQITIPFSVLFRFFPTVKEEYVAISEAMRMRGIQFGGGKPEKILEYRLVPLMISCVKIGDELSSAALVRGLGAPVKRTNLCKIGFSFVDILLMVICVLSIVLFVFNTIYVL